MMSSYRKSDVGILFFGKFWLTLYCNSTLENEKSEGYAYSIVFHLAVKNAGCEKNLLHM